MIKYNVKQNKNESSTAYQKWYAYPVVEETIDLAGLAAHMEEHNTGFSEAMCIGVLKAMVKCIKEQLLSGKSVKIDDLAIFSVGIRNRIGAESEEFTTANISGVKLRARATGTLSNTSLNLAATLKRVKTIPAGSSSSSSGSGGSSGSTDSGSDSGGVTVNPGSGDLEP